MSLCRLTGRTRFFITTGDGEQAKSTIYPLAYINSKTKHLMAMSIALVRGSMHCSVSHTILAADLGATKDEVLEAFAVALVMGGTPVMALGTRVMKVLKEKRKW